MTIDQLKAKIDALPRVLTSNGPAVLVDDIDALFVGAATTNAPTEKK